jgi:hypothetical protein
LVNSSDKANAAHIARLDPQTVLAAFTELRDLRAAKGEYINDALERAGIYRSRHETAERNETNLRSALAELVENIEQGRVVGTVTNSTGTCISRPRTFTVDHAISVNE